MPPIHVKTTQTRAPFYSPWRARHGGGVSGRRWGRQAAKIDSDDEMHKLMQNTSNQSNHDGEQHGLTQSDTTNTNIIMVFKTCLEFTTLNFQLWKSRTGLRAYRAKHPMRAAGFPRWSQTCAIRSEKNQGKNQSESSETEKIETCHEYSYLGMCVDDWSLFALLLEAVGGKVIQTTVWTVVYKVSVHFEDCKANQTKNQTESDEKLENEWVKWSHGVKSSRELANMWRWKNWTALAGVGTGRKTLKKKQAKTEKKSDQ